ncbi:MAG: glycosyltransferase [Flavobacteriales bacterium]|nr:glycosyltransferase [Flavobacteriales bacterium]
MTHGDTIVLVGPAYPLRGGIAHFNESLAYRLQEDGFAVKIASFYLQYPSLLFPGKTQIATEDPPRDLEIHNTVSSINPTSWRRTAQLILSWRPKVVAIRFWLPFMGPSLGYIARKLRSNGVAVIGLVDNAIPHESRVGDKFLSKRFFKNCDAFFTLSDSVAEDLQKLAPGRPIETSPHPVYDLFGEKVSKQDALNFLNLEPNYQYILFFGFVRKYKGLDLLMKGFANAGLKKKKVKLLVAGEFYDDPKIYLELAHELNLEEAVVFRDQYIPEDEVKYYFCISSIVAQTYRTATQSGVTQIAYHFERPMLVTNVGGLAEIVPNNKAGFVTAVNEKAIAHSLARFFQENLEEPFADFVSKEKDRFSWSHFSAKFVSFVNKIQHAN